MRRRWGRMARSAQNALELVVKGRLGSPYSAPHEVVATVGFAALRRYDAIEPLDSAEDGPTGRGPALLFVPPLMVTAEVYDISPELSAVASCLRDGLDVWLVDFGKPETAEGGMDRTLSEHVEAVAEALASVGRLGKLEYCRKAGSVWTRMSSSSRSTSAPSSPSCRPPGPSVRIRRSCLSDEMAYNSSERDF